MKKLLFFSLLFVALVAMPDQAQAQLFKKKDKKEKKDKKSKKKKGQEYGGFAPPKALSPEEQKAQMINPMRKILNMFNVSVEKGYGFFNYQNQLTGVSVVRSATGEDLFIVPNGQLNTQPVNGYSNWFDRLSDFSVNRIDDDAQIVDTDTTSFIYKNSGRLNPFTLRLSYSFRKVDKAHLKRSGERRMTDKEFLRIGGGISFGKIKFKNAVNTQDIDGRLGNFPLPVTELSTTKMFGSVTYNAYQYSELSFLLDVSGGVWKTKANTLDDSQVQFDPFFNIGFIFEKTVSKYFKVYIRPSFEVRQYSLTTESVTVPHKFSVFTIDIGALIKYPIYPRNRYKAHRVQMEHVFNGKIYRGRSIFQRQNPRAGQFGTSKKEKVRYGNN